MNFNFAGTTLTYLLGLTLAFFWFLETVRTILFWVYLWQLKEYHIGRFIDHFRTYKGKKLLINRILILKIILAALPFFITVIISENCSYGPCFFIVPENYRKIVVLYSQFYTPLIILFFGLGAATFALNLFKKSLKKPVFTKKTVVLVMLNIAVAILFSFNILFYQSEKILTFYPASLLIFNILIPVLISAIVLLLQPIAVLEKKKLIKMAIKKRNKFPNLTVIGITGSYGKTSTKELLYAILAEKFGETKVLKTKEHQNSEVGISRCILDELNENHEIFVAEMGAYNRGGIKLLCDIAKPKMGILTGINEQHMATFGSQDDIIRAKYELIENLPDGGIAGGTAIFNGDNAYCFQLYEKTAIKKRIFSVQPSVAGQVPDLWARNINIGQDHLNFKAISKDGEEADFKVNILGEHGISNILGAAIAAKEFGLKLDDIAGICSKLKQEGGMRLKKGANNLNIIDSTYSANPDGVIAALEYLKTWPGKKIIVMPCLIELGKASSRIHRKIGNKIGEICDLAIITTKDRFSEIKYEAERSVKIKPENILYMENPDKIYKKIMEFCIPAGTLSKEDQGNGVVLLQSRVPKKLIDQLIVGQG